jgi:hypothetical protein
MARGESSPRDSCRWKGVASLRRRIAYLRHRSARGRYLHIRCTAGDAPSVLVLASQLGKGTIMTKKDYANIAAQISGACLYGAEEHEVRINTLHEVAGLLASMLAADNPRFNRATFLAACNLPDNPLAD